MYSNQSASESSHNPRITAGSIVTLCPLASSVRMYSEVIIFFSALHILI